MFSFAAPSRDTGATVDALRAEALRKLKNPSRRAIRNGYEKTERTASQQRIAAGIQQRVIPRVIGRFQGPARPGAGV